MTDHDRPTNRLVDSSSPYLLLHKHNPVDWYPWGDEALARSRTEDKPIFVSVGYSTCYWCHVMERESFSDERIAGLMNAEFVNIKLDREERPDLDEIYMTATQILSGQGGWPNSVFLTPKLEPFFAGTYFPPEDRPGLPSFRNVLLSMADAWHTRRGDVEKQAGSIAAAIRHHLGDRPEPAAGLPGPEVVDRAFEALARSYDREWGGFGGAPKFPTPANLLLLEELSGREEQAADMLAETLDRMARGGIYDQLAGGFHRYATDREWKVPHFEKMLYDNGWLLEVYARHFERTQDPQAAGVLRQTAEFIEHEMTSPGGGLYSALDAETGGEEGAYYVWSREDLLGILGEEDFGFLAPIFGFDGSPFFEHGTYVLHLPERLERQAERRRMDLPGIEREIDLLRRKLLRARSARRRPLVDDKVLADWNGVAIAGLAEAGRVLRDPGILGQAERAADFVLREMRDDHRGLRHAWRGGSAHTPAMLADYAFLVRGLLALANASDDARWLEAARDLTREQSEALRDPEGGFFIAPAEDSLLVRSRDIFDGAMPAANGVAVLNLLDLAARDADGEWRAQALEALRAFAPTVERVPDVTKTLAVALLHAGPGAATGLEGGDGESVRTEDRGVVTASLATRPAGAFTLELVIAAGWHLYRTGEAAGEEATVVPLEVEARDGELSDLEIRAPRSDAQAGEPDRAGAIYSGQLAVSGVLVSRGPNSRLVVSFQACNDRRCLAPESLVIPWPQEA
jgi:uncharacterized protein YyaL (SSP411 family)